MKKLEKILEEIDKATDEYGMVDYVNDEPVISKNQAKDIILKYLSRENASEITRLSRDIQLANAENATGEKCT